MGVGGGVEERRSLLQRKWEEEAEVTAIRRWKSISHLQ